MPSAAERRGWLRAVAAMLNNHGKALCEAISSDFGYRPETETRVLELFPSLEGLRHADRQLARWMRIEPRKVSVYLQPARAEIRYQPLGVVGVVAPWNYPLYLIIGPLTCALAAGNRVMIKVSEYSPALGALLVQLMPKYLPEDLVRVVLGDAEVAREFVGLPFDHLLFTGSTAVGRAVMSAAARNLTPVTLELGGKSPAIIAPGFDLRRAARSIIFGKLVNAGQTCIAPDYVLCPQDAIEPLLVQLAEAAKTLYGNSASPDYASIAHDRQYARLQAVLEDARRSGARIRPLMDQGTTSLPRRMPLVAVLETQPSMRVMQEELFGPILPILPYRSLDEVCSYVNQHDRPLALYVFDDDHDRRESLLARTASGGVTINDTLLHVGQDDLPFGGVGPSGMGRYHGIDGFRTFSQIRSVFRQPRLNFVSMMYPPYDRAWTKRLLNFLVRTR
jgi:coniferyl-aldehyde dehydrogenase